jgi:hypothetical protein
VIAWKNVAWLSRAVFKNHGKARLWRARLRKAQLQRLVARTVHQYSFWRYDSTSSLGRSPSFFETPRRFDALGHVADEEGHEMLRSLMEESEKVREDARNLMLFEWASGLLVEDDRDQDAPESP